MFPISIILLPFSRHPPCPHMLVCKTDNFLCMYKQRRESSSVGVWQYAELYVSTVWNLLSFFILCFGLYQENQTQTLTQLENVARSLQISCLLIPRVNKTLLMFLVSYCDCIVATVCLILHQYNKSEPTREAPGSKEITHSFMPQRSIAFLNKSVGLELARPCGVFMFKAEC